MDGHPLEMRLVPERDLARFELVEDQIEDQHDLAAAALVGAGTGAVLGTLLTVTAKPSSAPTTAVFGLLVGGLIGAALGGSGTGRGAVARSRQPDARRFLTLRYDDETRQWRVYHGPYVNWAKEALRAG